MSFFAPLALAALLSNSDWNAWKDRSPHMVSFVKVGGVKLEVLDWGGKGPALVFCNGWGENAHCFDSIAPKLTDKFHVLAFTRRGFGRSDHPATGYDADTLAKEIIGFLDAVHLRKASLAGHSVGGTEITLAAVNYPSRVNKLVYLDGIYDYNSPLSTKFAQAIAPFQIPQPPPDGTVEPDEFLERWHDRFVGGKPLKAFWNEGLENELHNSMKLDDKGKVIFATTDEVANQAFTEWRTSARKAPLPYEKVQAPALAFVVYKGMEPFGYSKLPPEKQAIVANAYNNISIPYVNGSRQRFEKLMKHGQVVPLQDTHHYCFIQREAEIVAKMKVFLLEKG